MGTPQAPGWQDALRHAWTRRGPLACILWPVSVLYGALVAVRQWLYRAGWLTTERVPVPVLVVGNVVAGGAGKTPVVMALVQHFQQRGVAVGVISRGHGRHTTGCFEVTTNTTATDVGDEPTLLWQRTGAPLFVAERRVIAARALLAAHPGTQLIVCDDGLQHLALHRDLDIGVFDDRMVGNGWLLPAGPLREPWPRPLDLQVHTGQHPPPGECWARRSLSPMAHRADGSTVALADLASAHPTPPLLALAAIAQPEVFFGMLRAQRVPLATTLALPDHYDFSSWKPNEYVGYTLICTEKDAVKLWQHQPQALAVPLVCTLPLEFWQQLDALTVPLLKPKG